MFNKTQNHKRDEAGNKPSQEQESTQAIDGKSNNQLSQQKEELDVDLQLAYEMLLQAYDRKQIKGEDEK